MAKSQCKATTKTGAKCSRKALKDDDFCGLKSHRPDGIAPSRSKSHARTTRGNSDDTENFSPSFKELLEVCRTEEKTPSDNSTKVQWVQVHLRIVVAALEHQRALDGVGSGVTYNFTMQPPAEPVPVEVVSEDEEKERVLN